MNKKKGYEQASDHGPYCFNNIDLAYRSGVFFSILGIKFTSISKKGSIGEGHGEEDQ